MQRDKSQLFICADRLHTVWITASSRLYDCIVLRLRTAEPHPQRASAWFIFTASLSALSTCLFHCLLAE